MENIELIQDEGQIGIDIAQWNLIRDYQAIKNAGVEFAITKVINASNVADKLFTTHVAGCNSVGIPIIAGYTYSYANTADKAKKASDAFVSVGAPKGINKMALDLEDKSMMGLGSEIVTIINIYKETAKAAGMDFLIYTGAQFYNPYLKPYAKETADIPVWWARYPYVKDYTITADIPDSKYLPTGIELMGWQYSSQGVIPGIQGYVDLNVWYSDDSMENTKYAITVEYNPFTEPEANVKLGTTGDDARWAQWYLWRFGIIQKEEIDGIIGPISAAGIKEAQRRLGLVEDAIVGKITRATWKKVA